VPCHESGGAFLFTVKKGDLLERSDQNAGSVLERWSEATTARRARAWSARVRTVIVRLLIQNPVLAKGRGFLLPAETVVKPDHSGMAV
jgi:hypothetical protein